MCDYFYNAFGELVKNKPNLIDNFVNVHKNKEQFVEVKPLPAVPTSDIIETDSFGKCNPPYNMIVNGACARINTCFKTETLSQDNKYCIKKN
jgi:hypothetical protein